MKVFGHVTYGIKVLSYDLMSKKQQERVQYRRLKKLVEYAKKNSPYFANLYKDIGENFKLTDLPVTSKVELMNDFHAWCTDPEVKLEDALTFMEDLSKMGEKYLGKYMLSSTSGSTGMPAVILQNDDFLTLSATVTFLRCFKWKMPFANVSGDDGYGIDNVSVHQYEAFSSIVNKISRVFDATNPPEIIVKQLNEFKPKIVIGYPSTLLLLTEPQVVKKIKLDVHPYGVYCGGEYLAPGVRKKLSAAFNAPVHSVYGCTEAGAMAFECEHNHLHPISDWVILEPVDKDNNPVKPGQMSDKLLLTCLLSFPQPIIRYEVTDRVIVHYDDCPCGKPGLWIEPEGRTNDIFHFEQNGEVVGVSPMSLIAPLEDTPGVGVFQVLLHPQKRMEVRITTVDGYDIDTAYKTAEKRLYMYFDRIGITDVQIYLSDVPPSKDSASGKFKQYAQVDY